MGAGWESVSRIAILYKMCSLEPKITRYTKEQENDQVKNRLFEKILKLNLADIKAVVIIFK